MGSNNTLTNITAMNSTNSSSYTIQGIVFSRSTSNLTNMVSNYFIGYGYPISLYGSNNTLTNITASNGGFGIDIGSSNNTLTNLTATNVTYNGIVVDYGTTNNNFTNIIASSFGGAGVSVYGVNNTLTNVTTSNYLSSYNSCGVVVGGSNNNLTNITASNLSGDGVYGVYITGSNNNLTNVTTNLDKYIGVIFSGSSNTVTNLVATNIGSYGVNFWGDSYDNSLVNAVVGNSSYNYGTGISLSSSGPDGNALINVTSILSNEGVSISSADNSMKNCNVSGNTINVYSDSFPLSLVNFSNNTVDYSYEMYYNSSVSNYVFNSTNEPNAGMIICENCNNVTYSNMNLSHKNYAGLYLWDTSNSFVNNITSTSNYDGVLLFGANNELFNVTANNANNYGIYLDSNSVNNTLSNINASLDNDGIYLDSNSVNNTLSNINASLDNDGIYLDYSINNTLSNINASLDASYGIWIYSGSDNNFTNIITDLSADYGIYIYSDLSDSMFSNVDTSSKSLYGYGNGVGIYLGSNSVNNTLSNINASLDNDGIYLGSNSVNNTLSNINATLGNYGIYLVIQSTILCQT